MLTRRDFLRHASSAAAFTLLPRAFAAENALASFFVVGDTHYCADDEDITRMDPSSAEYNGRLINWLNKLPGTEFSAEVGGGTIAQPNGVIHAGDLVDNADKSGRKLKMADTEMAAFTADWGLNGADGRLRWQVREVHGNHDGPRGETVVTDAIKSRNQRRAGLLNVSPSGLHYSWDWAGVHFVALGIVVGGAPEITRRRRYAPFDSLAFLKQDLAEHVGKSGKPIVLVHHVDVARYSETVPDEKVLSHEWDYADVQAYYTALREYRVAAAICGHTHARNIFRWNGTKNTRAGEGIPFLNTDNAAHFHNVAQAFLHVSVTGSELLVREFSTKDAWATGAWTPQVWKFDLA
jgi:predicted phosphodiesterase